MTKDHKHKSDDPSPPRKSEKEHKHKKDKKEKSHKRDKDRNDRSDIVPISIDDYFTKNEEFRVWLKLKQEM